MRIALYARVSTQDRYPEAQLQPLREYAERRGAEAVEFVDYGVSGRKDRRDALDQLTAAVRRREVDAVATVKLDRLARSVRHLANLAAERLASRSGHLLRRVFGERRREDIEDVIDEMRERDEASLNSYLTPLTRPLEGELLDDAAESVGAGPR